MTAHPEAVPLAAVGYIRVSTEGQATEDKTSLEDQRKAIRALALRLGASLGTIFEDPGVSGATTNRPGYQALKAYVQVQHQQGASGIILLLNASRLGRFEDPQEAAYESFGFKRQGWEIHYAEGDVEGEVRTVVHSLNALQASEYRKSLQRNVKRGLRGSAGQGFWSGRAPLGYRRQVVGTDRILETGDWKGPAEHTKLVLGPKAEVQIVQWLFETYANGAVSMGFLAREALKKWPQVKWSNAGIREILRNPAYLGEVVWGRTHYDRHGKTRRTRLPASEQIIVRDAHPDIIDRDLFLAVQARMAVNKTPTRNLSDFWPLTRLVTCECGRHYVAGGGPKKENGRYLFYRCSGSRGHHGPCPHRVTLKRQWSHDVIIKAVGDVVTAPETRRAIEHIIDERLKSPAKSLETQKRNLKERLKGLNQRRQRLVDAVADGTLSKRDIKTALDENAAEVTETERQLHQLVFRREEAGDLERERGRLLGLIDEFESQMRTADGETFKRLLTPWLEGAVVGGGNLTLTLRRIPFIRITKSDG